VKWSQLSDFRIKKILECFANELTAIQAARLGKVNPNTAERYYHIFREKIATHQERQKEKLRGQIEMDEAYFGSKHAHDPRGRSTNRKLPVLGLLKRNGQGDTEIIKDAAHRSMLPMIERLIIKSRSNRYTDQWKSYDALVTAGDKPHRINHAREFVNWHNQSNGLESFWS
jgi:transposase-like protein